MIHSEDTMPPVYIQDLQQDPFNKIADYLITEDSKSFILLGWDIYSTMLSKYQIFKLRVGWRRMGIWRFGALVLGIKG